MIQLVTAWLEGVLKTANCIIDIVDMIQKPSGSMATIQLRKHLLNAKSVLQ